MFGMSAILACEGSCDAVAVDVSLRRLMQLMLACEGSRLVFLID